LILANFVICSILLGVCACSSQEKTTTPKGISLSDAPQVLDITGALPPNFEHLDAGAGIKWFVAKKVAVRIEYRFISYDGREATARHNLFIGISIFL
jgi:hypothetical protein